MCFSRENGCTEPKHMYNYNNYKKTIKNLQFWDCNKSMIDLIVEKLSIKMNGEYKFTNQDNIDELKNDNYNSIPQWNIGDSLLDHDDKKYDEGKDIRVSKNERFERSFIKQSPNEYVSIDGQLASHGEINEKYVYDEKTNNIVLDIINDDKYYQDGDAFLLTDASIELYPNKNLRYGNKMYYCNGKFSSLTDSEWFEFIYQNYLHFIIKMYKSSKIQILKDKQIFTQVINATNADNVKQTWQNVQKFVVRSRLQRNMAML